MKRKIYLGVLVIIIFIFVAIILYAWWLTQPRYVFITTDKKVYQPGETVKITLKSDSIRPIYYSSGKFYSGCPDSKLPGCMITSNDQSYYSFDSSLCVTKIGKYEKINPNTELSTQWNQILYHYSGSERSLEPAKEGTYRLECKYATQRYNCLIFPGLEWYCIFRNPFFKYPTFYSSDFVISKLVD